MPFTMDGRITGIAGDKPHSSFEEAVANLHEKYMARASAFYRTNRAQSDAADTSGQKLLRSLRNLHPTDLASMSRVIEEYRVRGNNLAPLFLANPGEWEMIQKRLDDGNIASGVPLPATRHKPVYQRIGVFAPNVFAQLQRERDMVPREQRMEVRENMIDDRTKENQITFINGWGVDVGCVYRVACGPRLCGTLSADGKSCAHPTRLVDLTSRPLEWRYNFGWVGRRSPFLLGHVPEAGGEVWKPVFDFDGDGNWVQMREYDAGECAVYEGAGGTL